MKIEKEVNDKGNVIVRVTGVPSLPQGTMVSHPSGYSYPDGRVEVGQRGVSFEIGDFKFTNTGSYVNTDSARFIANTLNDRFYGFFAAWAAFKTKHTETIEIKTVSEVAADLHRDSRLYYRNAKGQIKRID